MENETCFVNGKSSLSIPSRKSAAQFEMNKRRCKTISQVLFNSKNFKTPTFQQKLPQLAEF